MITVTLRDAVNNTDILRQLSTMTLKGRTAYDVGKLLKRLEDELNLFTETRTNLINRYANKDENGELVIDPETQEYKFTEENMRAFVDEINAVLDREIEINANKIKLDDLGETTFTPMQMMALEAFIEE